MRPCNLLFLLGSVAWCSSAAGQAVQHKHLLTTFGGGGGVLHMRGSEDSSLFNANGIPSGVVRFAFGYAFADRWSIGMHYDRIGSDNVADSVDRVRCTTYQVEGTYRPWIGRKAALETHLALGFGLTALTAEGARLPYRAQSGVYTIGARYVHMFGEILGAYLALDHSASGASPVDPPDGLPEQDEPVENMDWQADRLSLGLVVRF